MAQCSSVGKRFVARLLFWLTLSTRKFLNSLGGKQHFSELRVIIKKKKTENWEFLCFSKFRDLQDGLCMSSKKAHTPLRRNQVNQICTSWRDFHAWLSYFLHYYYLHILIKFIHNQQRESSLPLRPAYWQCCWTFYYFFCFSYKLLRLKLR